MPPFTHLDAAESVFFTRELESIDQRVYEAKLAPLKSRQLVPTQSGVPDWAHVYTWRMFEKFGDAKIISDFAADPPRADAEGTEASRIIKEIGSSYGFSINEIKAARATNTPLDTMRAMAARRAIETKIDNILALGDDDHGLEGLLNITNNGTYTLLTKAAGGTAWGTVGDLNATPREMVADLMGIAADAYEASEETWPKFVIALPVAEYNAAVQTPLNPDGSADMTVLKFAMANSDFIEEVVPWNRCKTAGSGSGTRMVAYPRDPEAVAGIVPMEYTPLPPQATNFAFKIAASARCGGVVARHPAMVRYADGV